MWYKTLDNFSIIDKIMYTVCLYIACTPMAMSVLGLNFEAPAASFTSKFLKDI